MTTRYEVCAHELLKLSGDKHVSEVFGRLAKMVPKGTTLVWDRDGSTERFGGGVYGSGKALAETLKKKMPKGDVVLVKRENPSVLAHELGHAEFNESTLGRVVQHTATRTAAGMLVPVAAVAAGINGNIPVAVLAPFLVNSPVPLGEAIASFKAVDKLRAAGMTEEEVSKAKRSLLKAFGTHAAIPARGAAAGGVLAMLSGK